VISVGMTVIQSASTGSKSGQQVDGCETDKFDVSTLPILFFLTFMGPCIVNIFLSTTNKMQRYIIFFIIFKAVRVSSGFSAHHPELNLYMQHRVFVKLVCCYR
jgi:hypothetical protein